MLTIAYGGSRWRVSEFTNLDLEEIFAAFPAVAVLQPVCLPLVSCVFVVSMQLHCSWRLLLAWWITSKDCIEETVAVCGPARTIFRHSSWPERHLQWEEQWQGVCKSRPRHGNTTKEISKTKGRHGASFASYCYEKVDNKRQRAIQTKECEMQNQTKWRTRREIQRNISQEKRMWAWIQWESAPLNKRAPMRERLELLRETK